MKNLGNLLGELEDIITNPKSNDVYVVRSEQGSVKYLPSIPEVLKDIDIQNKKIIVNLIEGL